jgi:phospholipid transport system transporter-binding protein
MPAADRAASLARDGDALRISGALLAATVPGLWRLARGQALHGVTRFDLRGVDRVDSAGVALLAELAARCDGEVALEGDPAGLPELCAAYRLSPSLAFAG